MQSEKENKKKTFLRKFGKFLLWSAAAWAIIIGAVQVIISEQNLSRIFKSFTEEYVDGEVSFGSISLSMFSHFPNAFLSLEDVSITYPSEKFASSEKNGFQGKIYKQGKGERTDTLAAFRRMSVSLNIPALLAKKIRIPSARLGSPRVFLHQYGDGKTNWSILPGMDGAEEEDSTESPVPDIVLGDTRLEDNAHIIYADSRDTVTALLNLKGAFLEGRAGTRQAFSKDLRMRVDSLFISGRVRKDSLAFALSHFDLKKNDRKLDLSTRAFTALATRNYGRIAIPIVIDGNAEIIGDGQPALQIGNFNADIAGFPLNAKGTLAWDGKKASIEAEARTDGFDLGEFLKKYGKNISAEANAVSTDAKLDITAGISGDYNPENGQLPEIKLNAQMPDSRIAHRNLDKNILIKMELDAVSDSTGRLDAAIKKFRAEGSGVSLNIKAEASDLLGKDPLFNIDMKTSAIADSLLWLLPENSGILAEGNLDTDIKGKIRLSQLDPYHFPESSLNGHIGSGMLRFRSDSLQTAVYLDSLEIHIGTEKADEKELGSKEKLMAVTASIDSTSITYRNSLKVNGSKATVSLQNSTAMLDKKDSATVHPIQGRFKAERICMTDVDSTMIIVRNTSNRFKIRPAEGTSNVPSVRVSSWTKSMAFRDSINRVRVTGMGLDMNASSNVFKRRARLKAFRDSLKSAYPETPADSLIARWLKDNSKTTKEASVWLDDEEFQKKDPDFRLSGAFAKYFTEWDINGLVNVNTAIAITPLFPVMNRIDGFKGTFNNNTVRLDKLALHSGKSELNITGELTGLKNALLRKGIISLDLDIGSPSMDLNELLGAWSAGQRFQTFSSGEQADANDRQYEAAVIQEGLEYSGTPSTIIIPGNINASIDLKANGMVWSKLDISKLSTLITMKERCIQMKEFKAESNMGNITMDAFYSSQNRKNLKAGFNIDLQDITAEDVIDLIPEIDTLMPPLKSFEGMLNCEFAATTDLDTNMNLVIPTTTGVFRIEGQDLSIKDSPEFRELAKTLMMKNKNEGHIQSMKVEAILKDGCLEIFPFKLFMDRYRLAMSGKQNLDMSYNYHISVLKSPVPFRLGVQISGKDFNKMKIRLGKAKYKNENIPSFTGFVDHMKINLVQSIRHIFEKGITRTIEEQNRLIENNRQKQDLIMTDVIQTGFDTLIPLPENNSRQNIKNHEQSGIH